MQQYIHGYRITFGCSRVNWLPLITKLLWLNKIGKWDSLCPNIWIVAKYFFIGFYLWMLFRQNTLGRVRWPFSIGFMISTFHLYYPLEQDTQQVHAFPLIRFLTTTPPLRKTTVSNKTWVSRVNSCAPAVATNLTN